MRQTRPIFLLIFWSKFLIPCTDVAAALESSRTRRIYPPTASQIIEDGLVLKEENCLFPWLSCVKITAQKIPSLALTASYLWLLKPFCVPGRPWPSLLLSLLHGAWGAVNVPFFKGSVEIHQTGTGWSKTLRNDVCWNSRASFSIPSTSKTDCEVAYLPPC